MTLFDLYSREEVEDIVTNVAQKLNGFRCANCNKELTQETAMYDTVALGILYCNEQCKHAHWERMSKMTCSWSIE